jgi:two-component system copper resistance phosphate regulon response regulator CusR
MLKILLIEDEPRLNEHLRNGLVQQGYLVDVAFNGSEGLEMASVNQYDLLVLDVMLPGQSGFDVLDNLKRFNVQVPVIIISALNNSERVIEGLDKGAIDYIKKPFDFGEFLARIRAVTRKPGSRNYTYYRVGDLEMDLISRKVLLQKNELMLTKREFMLLELLLINCNRVLSKTEIAEKVWEVNFDMSSNVIEVHLSQLRKKLADTIIRTKVGMGYYIEGELIRQ